MSKKSAFKVKLPFQKKEVEPRSLEDITADYQQALVKHSDACYRATLYKEEAEEWHKKLKSLNQEAHVRRELDAKDAEELQKSAPAETQAKESK